MSKWGFKPGSKRDPWREYWSRDLRIYLRVWRGVNRSGVPIGVSLGWTVEDMMPNPWSGQAMFRLREEEAGKQFSAMLQDYGQPSGDERE